MKELEFKNINNRISSEILNNAFDFLETTVASLSKYSGQFKYISKGELKASLISVTTSVELILKAKIASIDWREIFEKSSESDIQKLQTGEFASVSFKGCIKRIEKLVEQKLPAAILTKIENIRKTRNRLIHFNIETNEQIFAVIISEGIDVFIEFYRLYIKDSFYEEKDRTKELEKMLYDVDEYIKTRLATVTPKLNGCIRPKTYYFSHCEHCQQDTLILTDKTTFKCLFCEFENNIEKEAEWWSRSKNVPEICTFCDVKTLITLENRTGEEGEAKECILCGFYINYPTRWLLDINTGEGSLNSVRIDI